MKLENIAIIIVVAIYAGFMLTVGMSAESSPPVSQEYTGEIPRAIVESGWRMSVAIFMGLFLTGLMRWVGK
jgi:hypothetical protein